jgi:hypothetical protein
MLDRALRTFVIFLMIWGIAVARAGQTSTPTSVPFQQPIRVDIDKHADPEPDAGSSRVVPAAADSSSEDAVRRPIETIRSVGLLYIEC